MLGHQQWQLVNLANEKKLVFCDCYKNKVNIVPSKYLYRLRGCVIPLRIVPRKNICFVLLARSCFYYSFAEYFCTIFVIHQKNWQRYHPLVECQNSLNQLDVNKQSLMRAHCSMLTLLNSIRDAAAPKKRFSKPSSCRYLRTLKRHARFKSPTFLSHLATDPNATSVVVWIVKLYFYSPTTRKIK
jgi:hypothetical protein